MIEGKVNANREAVVSLDVFGPILETKTTVDVVVDTGFDDYLALPLETLAPLALAGAVSQPVQLADGSVVDVLFFKAEVTWHGVGLPITIQASAGSPLLGMRLMAGSRLTISVRENGLVRIESEP